MAYNYQFQIAPDSGGSPGTWGDVGPLSTALSFDVTGLLNNKVYWARVVAHDTLTTANSAPVQFTTRVAVPPWVGKPQMMG